MSGTTTSAVWTNQPPGPFVELINFADDEGFIGPKTCAKLAKDFVDNRDKAVAFCARSPDGDWFLRNYDKFADGFSFVGPEGACKFH